MSFVLACSHGLQTAKQVGFTTLLFTSLKMNLLPCFSEVIKSGLITILAGEMVKSVCLIARKKVKNQRWKEYEMESKGNDERVKFVGFTISVRWREKTCGPVIYINGHITP